MKIYDSQIQALYHGVMCPKQYTPTDIACVECPYAVDPVKCTAMMKADMRKLFSKIENGRIAESRQKPLELRISLMLRELGTPAHLLGYDYIKKALLLCWNEPRWLHEMTKGLYPRIAAEVNSVPSRIERAIRHAVEVTWSRGDMDVLNRFFGNTINIEKGKPTNTEFLTQCLEYLKLEDM